MRYKALAALTILIMLCSLTGADAGTIIVKPGKFDHFMLSVPDGGVAGESIVVRVQVYDAYQNLITNFSESGKEFRVTASGSATVQPSHLGPQSFPGGSASLTITGKKAEAVLFSIYEVGGTVPLVSKTVVIVPNKLDHFVVQAPAAVTAGKAFDVSIAAKDVFGNTVTDKEMAGKNITVTSTGTSPVRMIGPAVPDFKNGMALVSIVTERAGSIAVDISELLTGSKGKSGDIAVAAAALSSFKLVAPREAVAGEPFDVTVSAFDTYGNPVTAYASTGNGIELKGTGISKIEPSFVKSSDFRNNEAVVRVTYDRSEEISIVAREQNRTQEGKSSPVRILPAAADHFVTTTPDAAVAGQPFKVKIEAFDRFNNSVSNYNLTGKSVMLTSTGSGMLSPSLITPSEFVGGVAFVTVVYDRAESFSISASVATRRAEEEVKKEKRPEVRTTQEPAVPKKPAEKAAEPVAPKKPATPTVVAPERFEEKKEPVKPVKKEVAEPKKEVKKSEVKEQKVKEPAPVKETTVAKKEAVEPKEPVSKKPKRFEVNNVSIIEAKEKAMLVISVTAVEGQLRYQDSIESKQGREWLKLSLSPAVLKTEKSFKFKSDFVGKIITEDDTSATDTVNVYVELIPSKVTYDISKVKNSVIVTVSP